MINDYHRQCRSFVASLIEADRKLGEPPAGLKHLLKTYEQDAFNGELVTGPAAVCYFMSQAQPAGGSSGRDDWRFPVVVALKSTGVRSSGVTTGSALPALNMSGPHPTDFLAAIADLFHNRRPAGYPDGVYKCEIDPQGATATDEPQYQQLTAATTVVLTARLNRRR